MILFHRTLSLLLSLSLCSNTGFTATPLDTSTEGRIANPLETDPPPITHNDSLIGRGFLIKLTCVQDSKLNGDFRVGSDGMVHLPYNVAQNAAGMKLGAFQAELKKVYQQYFRDEPKIFVSIKQKRYWIEVLGPVKNPGSFLVKEKTTLDEILAMAGVRTEDLRNGFTKIEMGEQSRWVDLDAYFKGGNAHELPPWRGGERVLFQTERPDVDIALDSQDLISRNILVVGEVRNPGGSVFKGHADAYYYLMDRGGPTRDSDLSEVELLRTNRGTGEHEQISLGKISDIKNVQESDVLVIHAEKPSGFEKGLQYSALVATILSAVVLTVFVSR